MLGFPRLCRGNGELAASVARVACEGLPRGHRVILCSQRVVDCSGWNAADGGQCHCGAPSRILVTGRATRVRE